MAVKNHALDDRIVEAARAEFLEKGFRDASLHRIADRAGLTTGALYTRYKNKDDLFCSLVRELLEEVARHMEPIRSRYEGAQATGDPEQIVGVIREEEQIYNEILFRYPEACKLFFCRSDGSSLGRQLDQMMEQKAAQTVEYLKQISGTDVDLDGVAMIITTQFQFFRQILEKGYDRDKAVACLKTVGIYMDAGWKAIFEAIR